jgi:hypothetical protein
MDICISRSANNPHTKIMTKIPKYLLLNIINIPNATIIIMNVTLIEHVKDTSSPWTHINPTILMFSQRWT